MKKIKSSQNQTQQEVRKENENSGKLTLLGLTKFCFKQKELLQSFKDEVKNEFLDWILIKEKSKIKI